MEWEFMVLKVDRPARSEIALAAGTR